MTGPAPSPLDQALELAERHDWTIRRDREAADAQVAVLRAMLRQRKRLGAAILQQAWQLYATGLFQTYDVPLEDFTWWFIEEFREEDEDSDQAPYLRQIAYAVVRVLAPVYAAELAGQPFRDPDGQPVTAGRLLATSGILTKAIGVSWAAAQLDGQPAKQGQLFAALATESRDDLYALRDHLLDRPRLIFPYRARATPAGVELIFTLDSDHSAALLALLGPAAIELTD